MSELEKIHINGAQKTVFALCNFQETIVISASFSGCGFQEEPSRRSEIVMF